ncbi:MULTISPECIES: flagellar motor protein MotB [Pseudomonadaceae]|uniref:flagellar motor protein MotB n=1 Tax=Pseudomonadaceae TaxID=135621 RepID=UPI00187D5703|nr:MULTISPECIES: flagellar motor protein MotB [Pseudomonadaceae]MBE7927459.1 flagellar motor protein MotB [Pseudomonas saudiphocaensis]MCF6781752.1 flagellar motor protein MotB [Stutzerimonas stutzeri]MCF6804421.1 flagellar motor protein MotB [Stutzerimonas stutzeri]
MDNTQPIIVKRVKKVAGGHHGGAWKIALADFMTAMMAFFLVMWLMTSATPEQKRAISGYFQDPIGFTESASPHVIDLGGTPTPSPDRTLHDQPDPAITQQPSTLDADQLESLSEQMERERLEIVLQELQNKVEENPDLTRFKDQILFEITQDGLRIQIVDAENRPMFALGSAQLQPYFEDILLAMADTVRALPNKISISGHTDAKPYAGRGDFGNWELSAGRANAARRTLVAGGYPDEQVARVVGYASSALYDREDPLNPINRRIDILVLTKRAQRSIEGEQSEQTTPPANTPESSGGAAPGQAPAEPLQPPQLRERLNIFEEGVLNFDEQK